MEKANTSTGIAISPEARAGSEHKAALSHKPAQDQARCLGIPEAVQHNRRGRFETCPMRTVESQSPRTLEVTTKVKKVGAARPEEYTAFTENNVWFCTRLPVVAVAGSGPCHRPERRGASV